MMNRKALVMLIEAAAVKRTRIVANGSQLHIEVDAPGRSFVIQTDKGAVRTWQSIDAAAKWLRGLGIGQVALELAHWSPAQRSLFV